MPLASPQKRFASLTSFTSREKDAARTDGVMAASVGDSASLTATGAPPTKRVPKSRRAPHQSAKVTRSVEARVSPTRKPAINWNVGPTTTESPCVLRGQHEALAHPPSFPFDVYPTQFVFDSFEPNQTYTATLQLKNRTMTSTYVRVDRPTSCPAFELSAPHGADMSSRVAPGLSVVYTVIFKPTRDARHYEAELVVRAENGESISIPVRAYTTRGCLQLPTSLTLREAPVKGTSDTPLFLRNISEHNCVWRAMVFDVDGLAPEAVSNDLSCPLSSYFSITPSNGEVKPLCGGSDGTAVTVSPVALHFHPHASMAASGRCEGLLRFFLGPEGDVVQDVHLSAQAVELVGLTLEQTEVTFADTYVTTERQAVVRVHNKSNATVHFAWKSSYRASSESDRCVSGSSANDGVGSDGSVSGAGGTTCNRSAKSKSGPITIASGSLHGGDQRLDDLQHQSHHHFDSHRTTWDDYTGDEAFRIEPLSGVLYGFGIREFTVTFNPSVAVLYESMAFLDVTGLVNRLPLTLRGHGLGPRCSLEHSRLEIGDVYLNALHEYEVHMENISSIDCQYVIVPPEPVPALLPPTEASTESGAITSLIDFSSKFRFIPSHGTLGPGEAVKLRIELQSDRIGCFSEAFRVHVQGAVEEVPLLLKGRVLGPHFECSVDEFDFGNVSYNMMHERTVQISNTSPIPMHYTLRVPNDCPYADDLSISPATGVIAPSATETVTVTLYSRTVGDYDTALLVEVVDVGDVLDAIPIKATCMVPSLFCNTTELAFGGIFVGHPTTLKVSVLNESALTGMFELSMVGGDVLSDVVEVVLPVSTEHENGVHWIAPHQSMQMPVTLTAQRPGKLQFSIALRVLGKDPAVSPPHRILVTALASGPYVEVQPIAFQFGAVNVLQEEVREMKLKNTSPVPTPFSLVFERHGSVFPAFTDGAEESALAALPFPREPVFTVEPADGVLDPHSTLTVCIRAKPNEAMAFNDRLFLHHSLDLSCADAAEKSTAVTVKVTGKGIPIVSEPSMATVDFGDVLTTTLVEKTFTLHNYGRRQQDLLWQNVRSTKTKEGEPPLAFTCKPERASIPAGGAFTFTLSSRSDEPGVRTGIFTLKQSGTFKEILSSTVSANFVEPALACSTRSIHFDFANTDHLQAAGASPEASLVKSLTLKNITSKILTVSLRIRNVADASSLPKSSPPASSTSTNCVPFDLEGPLTIVLAPGDSYVVGVRCNPLYRADFKSHTAKAKLFFIFAHHTRKESVSLCAELRFPALVINPSALLEFGAVLRNTEKRRTIVLSNPSADLPARFEWTLRPKLSSSGDAATKLVQEVEVAGLDTQNAGDTTTSPPCSAMDGIAASVAKYFDIVPFTGMLLPGESQNIEVAYQGAECETALATAVCRVHGGPTYTIDVRASSNVVQAHCDKTQIDFGRIPYFDSATGVVTLSNNTLVPVTWDVDLSSMRHPECLRVSPLSGVLHDKARLVITFVPTVPDTFEDTLWVRIGHLDPQPIRLRGSGYMNRLVIATSPTVPVAEKEVSVYRAPFRAFTEALNYVESLPTSSQQRSVYASRTVSPPPASLTDAADESAANVPVIPGLTQQGWATLEAERLAFCRAIAELPASEKSSSIVAKNAADPPLFWTPRALRRSSVTGIGGKAKNGGSNSKLVLVRYVVDFGHLTRRDVRKATLKLTNPSATEGVSAMLDTKELELLPISVNHLKTIKVGPLDTTTIELSMDATKPEGLVRHGKNCYEFAIDIRNGPVILVECRCYVANPSLRSEEKEVVFGRVLVGHVKVLPLVLTNPEAVSCPWRVTCKEGAASDALVSRGANRRAVRDAQNHASAGVAADSHANTWSQQAAQFWVREDHGVVAPNGTLTIDVYYAPNSLAAGDDAGASKDDGTVPAAATLIFRCGKGSAESVLSVKLSGVAFKHKVSLSTRQLMLPVVRPQQVIHGSVTLTNNEEFPVEVYSLGLDTQHAKEVKLLRRALEASPDHDLFLQHLEAGESLPDSLLEAIFTRLHKVSDSLKEPPAEAELAGAEATAIGSPAAADKGGKALRGQTASATSRDPTLKGEGRESHTSGNQFAVASSDMIENTPEDGTDASHGIPGHSQGAGDGGAGARVADASVVLLVGPPYSGKTTLAQQMAQRADAGTVILVDIDELIRREADRDDTANAAVARFLLTHMEAGAPECASSTADKTATTTASLAASYVACAPKIVRDALLGHLRQCIADHAASFCSAASSGSSEATPQKLRFLFEGLECTVLQNPWRLYELLKETCNALHMSLDIVSLAVSNPMSGFRKAKSLEAHHEARVAAASLPLLSEAAFEALDKEARDDYTHRLKHFNDCRRDLKAAQQLKRDYMMQLPCKTVQQEAEEAFIQAEVDAQKALLLESTTKSARKGKAAGGSGRGASPTAAMTKPQEPKWADLDAAAQFREWYMRFLGMYGIPHKTDSEGEGASGVATGRSTSTTTPLKGAAAAAAAAAEEEKAKAWASVLCVAAETEAPDEVASAVEFQLAQRAVMATTGVSAATNSSALMASPGHSTVVSRSASPSGAPGAVPLSASFTENDEAAAATPKVSYSPTSEAVAAAAAATSRIGEWFYLNEGRLRFWGNGAMGELCAIPSVLGQPSSVDQVVTAVANVAGATDVCATLDAAEAGRGGSFAFPTGSDTAATATRCVHFFSTLEREVIPAKRNSGRMRSMPSCIRQEEEVTRWWLPPKASVTLTVEFCCDNIGHYVEKCLFGVAGTLQQLCLTVSTTVALSDISRDPRDIFPVIKPHRLSGADIHDSDQRMPKVYIASKKLFDFGPLLIPPPPAPRGRRRSGEKVGMAGSSSTGGSGRCTAASGNSHGNTNNSMQHHINATLGEEMLTFVNREAADAEVTLSFLNEKEKTFSVAPSSFVLKPGTSQQVCLRATPEKVGDFTNTLLACIKDSPLPWKTEVTCTGARPTMTVNGLKELEVNFGRLVLNRSMVKSFSLVNEGPLPLQWKLVPVLDNTPGRGNGGFAGGGGFSTSSTGGAPHWLTELQFSALEGVIEEGGTSTLNVTFAPTHPCLYTRNMVFTVSNAGHSQQVVYESVPITIKAEGFDVILEWTREIQLGVLHVGEEKREIIRILNKSPYEVGYQMKLPKRLQKWLTLSNPSGTLRGMVGFKDAAIVNIEVTARLEKEGELPAKISLIEAAFFEVEKKELLYPVQSIPVIGEAWYTKYTVEPPRVNFGSCLVGQLRECTFEVRNTGVFPLEYSLFNYRDAPAAAVGETQIASTSPKVVVVSPSAGTATAGAAGHASSAETKKRASKGSELEVVVGAFRCRPCLGNIPVGGVQTITVSTVPGKQNRSHETIGVRVLQSGPELERYGTPVEVSAYPALPSIASDLTSSADIETIFEEQRVVYRLDQLAKGVRAYSKEERLFSFGTVLAGQRCEERFRIANNSPLPCTIVAHLEGVFASGLSGSSSSSTGNAGGASGGHKFAAGGGAGNSASGGAGKLEGFDLSPDVSGASSSQARAVTVKMLLPPYESRFLTVGFTPASLRRFQAQLIAVVENAVSSSDGVTEVGQQLRFGLCGEGTLPRVDIEVPPPLSSSTALWSGSKAGSACVAALERIHRRADGCASSLSDRKRAPRRVGGPASSTSSSHGHTESSPSSSVTEVLELPLTRVGAAGSRSFTLRNTGCLPAQVHLELTPASGDGNATPSPALTITSGGPGGGAVKKHRLSMTRDRIELFVGANQSEIVEVTYAPTQVEAIVTRMRVVLRDNPFEEKEVYVLAHSFDSPITFEGIDPSSPDLYDIGDCWIGVKKNCTFTLRNNTDSLVRYKWEYTDPVVKMVPSLGHLGAGASRQITAVVCSTTQNLQQLTRCIVHVQSIELCTSAAGTRALRSSIGGVGTASGGVGGEVAPGSGAANAAIMEWDNSMQSPRWVLREDDIVASATATGAHSAAAAAAFLSNAASMVGRRNLKQVMESLPEPAHTVVDTVTVTQSLTLVYRCSVPTYQFQLVDAVTGEVTELKAISFERTFLMQERVAVVRVINTGAVGLPLAYTIAATPGGGNEVPASTSLPQDLSAQSARHSGSVVPATGVASRASLVAPSLESDADALHKLPGYDVPNADFSVARSPGSSAASAVPSGSHVDLLVKFTPRTVGLITGELILSMPQSDPAEVRVPLQGVAECPLVHFSTPPPTNPDARLMASGCGAVNRGQDSVIVEFLACGLHTKTTVKFPVVNPSAAAYSYEWVEENMGRLASSSGRCASSGGGGAGSFVSPFRCLTPMGVIAAGSQAEAIFEFFADALGVRESAWCFHIPGHATIPFLLVGTAIEPNVYLHSSKVIFGHVQVGTRAERTVILENCDDIPYTFSWDKFSMEGMSSFLSVRPLRGTIAPHERLPVTLLFSPQDEVEYNLPLRCTVKRSSVPLSINVKGVGVSLHDTLQVEPMEDGEEPTHVVRGQLLLLNLHRVQVKSTVVRRFALRNAGSYPFQYSVEAPENPSITLEGMAGEVASKQTSVIVFRYHPTCEETLKQCRLFFRIDGRVLYKIGIKAVSYLPRLQLSFDHYDFGPRFISAYSSGPATGLPESRPGTVGPGSAVTVLQLTNLESEVVSVDCSVSTQNTWCRLDSTALVVHPKETGRLRLTFLPLEIRRYEDNLRLSFNSLNTVFVPVSGEGVVPRVEVVNPFAKFGVVRVGETQQVDVKLVCLSKIPTPISFAQVLDEDLLQKGFAVSLPQQASLVTGANSSMVMLKPKESITVMLSFTPKQRMGDFNREVNMLVCGVEMPFVSLSGSCADAEVHLDCTALSFGDVVIGASATRRVVILNSGDISQKFSWVNGLQKLRPLGEWSIFPSSGFVRAHTELACELRYAPRAPQKDNAKATAATTSSAPVQQTLTVELDNSPDMALTIESNWITRPTATEVVRFTCRAHEKDVKMIEVYNSTEDPWTTEPVLDSLLWTCPSQVTLKPMSKTMLSVTYQPARPTATAALTKEAAVAAGGLSTRSASPDTALVESSSSKDKATLFIPLPDGTGKCVALEGTAEATASVSPVQEYECVAHVSLPLRFQVQNWSTTEIVRFRREVVWNSVILGGEEEQREPSEDISSLICIEDNKGVARIGRGALNPRTGRSEGRTPEWAKADPTHSMIEVPPGASQDSVLTVTPLRDGVFRGTVHFTPLDTPGAAAMTDLQQSQKFVIRVRPMEAPPPVTIDLQAALRERASFNIPLANPLSKPAVFKLELGAADGTASSMAAANLAAEAFIFPSAVTVPGHTHAQAPVQFFPLISRPPTAVRCTVTSADLSFSAVYIFRLSTTSDVAAPERPTRLVCPLGQHTNFALRFTHYSKTNTEFAVRVNGEALGKGVATYTRIGASGQGPTVKASACPSSPFTSTSHLPKGQEVSVEFNFEPSELGERTDTIEFVSPVAGTYTFPIVATCTLPERQGPFVARYGQSLQLPFKNVFSDPVVITVSSDSASFLPSRKMETIPARKAVNVAVQFKPEEGVEVMRSRVIISCVPPGKQTANQPQQPIQWVYYVEATSANDRSGSSKQFKNRR
ncbi:hypothetical protein JKF63_02967 [Porcisia hertigi]|uniref:Hydrocephalus-inducing protein n=1 Tax=Porcisia hertigi TaxID=2761500 RepID=A0A836L899_9TRYP|nr:hypothetical protein JKF63_02967 [Porcisia hertigi]